MQGVRGLEGFVGSGVEFPTLQGFSTFGVHIFGNIKVLKNSQILALKAWDVRFRGSVYLYFMIQA